MTTTRITFILIALLYTLPASAQTPRLSLDEAVALALRHNLSLATAEMQALEAEEDLATARSWRLPQFKIDAAASQLLEPVDVHFPEGAFGTLPGIGPVPSAETTITTPAQLTMFVNAQVTQPLSQLFRINLNVRASEAAREIEREQVRGARIALVNQVKRLYFTILRTESGLTATAHSIALLREVNRTVSERQLRQVALKSEALDVEARLAEAEHMQLTLRNTLASHKEQLNRLLGRDVRTAFDTDGEPAPSIAEIEEASSLERALAARPDIAQAKLRVQQAELARRIARSERIPDVSLAVSYLSPVNVDGAPRQIAAAGVQLQWEPFDWGRRGRAVAVKDLEVRQARNALRDAEDNVILQVTSSQRRLTEARSLLRVAALARDTARETARVRASQFQVQAVLLADVLHAQSGLADADHRYQQALLGLGEASADYELALGQDVTK